jgi:hypothetical protein
VVFDNRGVFVPGKGNPQVAPWGLNLPFQRGGETIANHKQRSRGPNQNQYLAVLLALGAVLACIALGLEGQHAAGVLTATLAVATVVVRKR